MPLPLLLPLPLLPTIRILGWCERESGNWYSVVTEPLAPEVGSGLRVGSGVGPALHTRRRSTSPPRSGKS